MNGEDDGSQWLVNDWLMFMERWFEWLMNSYWMVTDVELANDSDDYWRLMLTIFS